MRTLTALLMSAALAGPLLSACALVTVPEGESAWTQARMAEDPGREAPAFVPEIPRPAMESWRMATAARELADTRDLVVSQAQLIQLPPIDPLVYGQEARERATPPPPPARRD
ncbi:MAG: hypothetical protein ACXIVO_02080 [Glycocaulis sp.]